jgi:hypothetical protein
MEERLATAQPAIIYLITSRGYLASPPLEWKDDSYVEHSFEVQKKLYVNGFFVAHPDGAVLYQSPAEMSEVPAGETFSVKASLSDDGCDDPTCGRCGPST